MTLEHLIILDASINKVGSNSDEKKAFEYIAASRFFDLKNKFSNVDAPFPNTVPSSEQFQVEARKLGINNESLIVVYDSQGIYSSPRVWWLFKLMGFNNIKVLDGGLPKWKEAGFATTKYLNSKIQKGNFIVQIQPQFIKNFEDVQLASDHLKIKIIDVRSSKRFLGMESEPRLGLRRGHIPNSLNLPYDEVSEQNSFAAKSRLIATFNNFVEKDDSLIFSCGSGGTACIVALAAEIAGYQNISVYDGSWTEWGSLTT